MWVSIAWILTPTSTGRYPRRLIEHALDPKSWSRELEKRRPKIDPETEAFEGAVLHRLVERATKSGQSIGRTYHLAWLSWEAAAAWPLECDGDNFQDQERLRENMERQAILERLGWKFVRVRGSLFFRDPIALWPRFSVGWKN